MTDLLSALRPLARVLAPLVAEELRCVVQGAHYSTEPGRWPPDCRSRRQARDRIRRVAGHEQIGRGKATVYRVLVAAYETANVTRRPSVTRVTDDDEAEVEAEAGRALDAKRTRPTIRRRSSR